MQIKTNRKAGFTLVEIMIVVAIIGLLAAIAIPNFVRARASSQANACINNMRQIDAAKQTWGLENNKKATDAPDATALKTYLGRGTGSLPTCPAGGTSATFATSYTINDLSTAPVCLIGAALTPAHVLPVGVAN
jgi:prepilin-type N-terminal cleavage/methylation domain-containing protein